MNKMFFFIFLTILSVYARDNWSISHHESSIYLLNGFEKELSIFSADKNKTQTVNLRNISPSGFYDFFIRYDKYLSYLVDSENSVIFLLDENYALKKRSDMLKTHGIKIYKKIFPAGYNSLLIASYEKDRIYSLTNNILKEILSFEKEFTDIFVSRDGLYVLTGSEISVYSTDGIFRSKISLNPDMEYNEISLSDGNVMTGSSGKFSLILLSERKISQINIDVNSCSVPALGQIYFFNTDSLKLKSVKP